MKVAGVTQSYLLGANSWFGTALRTCLQLKRLLSAARSESYPVTFTGITPGKNCQELVLF